MKIILIGYRATGKSTIGQMLARKLTAGFCDTDALVEKDAGKQIKEIVALEGWDSFRAREKDAVRSLEQKGACVVATGGGVVLDRENVELLKRAGVIIWLKTPLKDIIARLKRDAQTEATRPQFSSGNIVQETQDMMQQRLPLYEKTADYIVDTTGKNTAQVTEEIYLYLLKSGNLDKMTQNKN